MSSTHLDDFVLLRYVARDLGDFERASVERHLRGCGPCRKALSGIVDLDHTFHEITEHLRADAPDGEDPAPHGAFRRRPSPRAAPTARHVGPVSELCLAAAREAPAMRDEILAEKDPSRLAARLRALALDELPARYGLGQALDEASERMVEGPGRWLALAEAALGRLAKVKRRETGRTLAELAYPLQDLEGRAHLVGGMAFNWLGDYRSSGAHLRRAYRAFAAGSGSELSFARTELTESQRLTFAGRPHQGLVLARRAGRSFGVLGLTEFAARAEGAVGLALSYLGREEEALVALRTALPVFARAGLWPAYVTTLQNAAACLLKLGRLPEARREYARALRKVAPRDRSAVTPFIQGNLARLLYVAERYQDAARAFAAASALFVEQGAAADALVSDLYEIECLSRSDAREAAERRLERFQLAVERQRALTPSVLREIRLALTGDHVDHVTLAGLRQSAEEKIRRRLARDAG